MKSELLNRLALAYVRANKKMVSYDLPQNKHELVADVMVTFTDGSVGTFETSLYDVHGDVRPEKGLIEKHSRSFISAQKLEEKLIEWAVEKLDPSARKQAEKGTKRGRPRVSPSLNGSASPN